MQSLDAPDRAVFEFRIVNANIRTFLETDKKNRREACPKSKKKEVTDWKQSPDPSPEKEIKKTADGNPSAAKGG